MLKGRALEPVRVFFFDKGRGHISRNELRMIHDGRKEGQVMADPFDFESIERDAHFLDRIGTGWGPCAEFGDHRVVIHANFAAFEHACVVADGAGVALDATELAWDAGVVLGDVGGGLADVDGAGGDCGGIDMPDCDIVDVPDCSGLDCAF